MLYSNADLELQVRERNTALEVVQRLLAKRENDLMALQAYNRQLEEQLAREKSRAERLTALAERYGTR